MRTLEEVLELLDIALDKPTLEAYVSRSWVRPVRKRKRMYFEEIDIARIRLVHQLHHEMDVDESAMDMVLSLLDQVYGLRQQMRVLTQAIEQQPREVRTDILSLLADLGKDRRAD